MLDAHQAALASFESRLLESDRFHMAAGKVHETLRAIASDLSAEQIAYAVVGGMALNAHGYRRETVVVGVLVRPEGLMTFTDRLVGRGYARRFAGAKRSFRHASTGVAVEFLTTGEFPGDGKPKPVAFPDPAAVAENIGGVDFVNLEALISLKLASGMTAPGRRRDLADVQDLIRVLHLDATFTDRLPEYVRATYRLLLDELSVCDPHEERPTGETP